MDAELCAAELMARNSHEHPEMPWDFHVDMARQTWDELRHAKLHSPADAEGARLPLGRLPGRLLLLPLRLRPRPARPPRPLQLDLRAEGDVAPLPPPQGPGRPRPGADRPGVRLPARRRGPPRPQRHPLGHPPAAAATRPPTSARCASCARGWTRPAPRRAMGATEKELEEQTAATNGSDPQSAGEAAEQAAGDLGIEVGDAPFSLELSQDQTRRPGVGAWVRREGRAARGA